jgi:hypothetical protein
MADSGTLLSALLASLWSENSLAGRVLITCILALLAHGWVATHRHLRRYRSENANLDRVIARLGQWHAAREAAKTAAASANAVIAGTFEGVTAGSSAASTTQEPAALGSPPEELAAAPGGSDVAAHTDAPAWISLGRESGYGAADIETLREGVDRSSLIAERLEAIAKMRLFQVKINLGTLQQLTEAKEAARRGMTAPTFAAGTAMMLGLLGTFIGLAIMAQRIYFALPASAAGATIDTWTSAFRNVTAVLAGIKIAFSTSLVGIFCAVVASSLGHRLRSTQTSFSERLERFTAEDLLPATVPSVEDESLLERVTVQIENAFIHLDGVFRQNADALKEMTGAQQAFVAIVEEIRLVTKSEASRNLEGIVEQVAATNRAVLKLVEQLPRLATALDNGQRRLTEQVVARLAVRDAAATASSTSSVPVVAAWILAAIVVLLLALRLYSH